MNTRLFLCGAVLILSLCSSASGSDSVYAYPGGNFDTTSAPIVNAINLWGYGSTEYYGQVFSGLQTVYSFSFYLCVNGGSGTVATDKAIAVIIPVSNDGQTIASAPVWTSTISLGQHAGGPSPATLTWSGKTFNKVTATVSGGIALNPNSHYWLAFYADATSNSYASTAYVWATDAPGAGWVTWSNTNDNPVTSPLPAGLALENMGGGGYWGNLVFEIQSTGGMVVQNIAAVTPVSTAGGPITITGAFGTAPTVTVGGSACPIISANATAITCNAPAGFGANISVAVACTNGATVGGLLSYFQICNNGTNLPVLNVAKTTFAGDSLTITIDMAISNNWVSTTYMVGNQAASQCSFPSAYSTFVQSPGCTNSFILQLPWGLHGACNFTADNSNPNYITYSSHIYVTTIVTIGSLRGVPLTRTDTDILNVAVRFPKFVTVNSTVSVYAPVNLLSAVTQQAYYADAADGTVSFDGSLQWPFALSGGSIITTPNGISPYGFAENTPVGQCPNGAACLQTFSFNVKPGNGTCVLSGNYVAQFTIVCRGAQECPLGASNNTATVSFSITSTDFCAVVTTAVTVSATLTSYSNSSKALVKTAYIQNATAFFVVAVTTISPLSLTQLTSVSILSGGATVATYTNFAAAGSLVSGVSNNAATSSFTLYFGSNIFAVPVDGSASFSVSATVSLSYADNSRKRAILAIPDQDSASASTDVEVQDSNAAGTASPSSPASSIRSVFSTVFLGAFALVWFLTL